GVRRESEGGSNGDDLVRLPGGDTDPARGTDGIALPDPRPRAGEVRRWRVTRPGGHARGSDRGRFRRADLDRPQGVAGGAADVGDAQGAVRPGGGTGRQGG